MSDPSLRVEQSSEPLAASAPAGVPLKKTYIKPLRTIVEIDARYADQIRDLLNVTSAGDGGEVKRLIRFFIANEVEVTDYGKRYKSDAFDNLVSAVCLAARPPAPAVEVREAKRLINERLEDLQTANALYGKDQRLSAPDKVARNDREISWLKDLRSYLSASPREMVVQKGLNSEGEHQTEHTAPKLSFPPPYLQFSEPLWKQHEYCIQRLMNQIGYPNSQSIFEAMKQLLNDADHIERQRALLTDPSPSSRSETAWQPIETAPHNTSVLLGWRDWRDGQWCVEVGAATTGQRYDNGYSNISQHGSATHWQSLPSEGPL